MFRGQRFWPWCARAEHQAHGKRSGVDQAPALIQPGFFAPDLQATVRQSIHVADREGAKTRKLLERVIHSRRFCRELRFMMRVIAAYRVSARHWGNGHGDSTHATSTLILSRLNL
jgi:hypothetical protein